MDVIRHWRRKPAPAPWYLITMPQAVTMIVILYLHYEVLKRIALGFGTKSLLMSPGIGLATPQLLIWLGFVYSYFSKR